MIGQEEALGISNYCKINQSSIGQKDSSNKPPYFVIGPHFSANHKHAEVFAPKVYFKNGDKEEVY